MIYRYYFEACLPRYMEYSMMVFGGYGVVRAGRAYEGK